MNKYNLLIGVIILFFVSQSYAQTYNIVNFGAIN